MLFYFFIGITFLAEFIIVLAFLLHLRSLSMKFCHANNFLKEVNPHIKDLLKTVTLLSSQGPEFAMYVKELVKRHAQNFALKNFENILMLVLAWGLKQQLVRIRNSIIK